MPLLSLAKLRLTALPSTKFSIPYRNPHSHSHLAPHAWQGTCQSGSICMDIASELGAPHPTGFVYPCLRFLAPPVYNYKGNIATARAIEASWPPSWPSGSGFVLGQFIARYQRTLYASRLACSGSAVGRSRPSDVASTTPLRDCSRPASKSEERRDLDAAAPISLGGNPSLLASRCVPQLNSSGR